MAQTTGTPPTPEDPAETLGAAGKTLWRAILKNYDLESHDRVILLEACRVKDNLDTLAADVRATGVTVESPQGLKSSPSLVESRQQQGILARLIASLRLPEEDDDATRPQRRGAARGNYQRPSRAMVNR